MGEVQRGRRVDDEITIVNPTIPTMITISFNCDPILNIQD